MKLVIAEKPSVAQSLARVIGADKRRSALQAFSTAARSVIIMPLSRQRRWQEAISVSFPLEKRQFCN